MNLEVSEHMHYDAIKKGYAGWATEKRHPMGGWGSCVGADVPQKYFSLNIGGKNEIL